MKSAFRAVVDTNVFVSSLYGSKICEEISDLFNKNRFLVIASPDLLEEFSRVLKRPKFRAIEEWKIERLEKRLRRKSDIVLPTEKVSVCRDPKDNMVLECALAGMADFIVTGDKDLLALTKFKGIRILTPQKFIKRLKD